MVKRLVSLLSKEVSGLHEAAYLLAFFSFLSQILAIIRDRIFAHNFGAGNILDIYYASFRVPDFIFVSVASLVSVSVLIPFITDKMKDNDFNIIKDSINKLFSFFLILILLSSLVTFFVLPYLIPHIFPGIKDIESINKIILFSRILLLSPIFLGISGFFGAVAQTYKKFVAYAFAPVLYNLGIISGVVFFYPKFGENGLVYGVVFGAVLHCLIQIPSIIKCNLLPRFTFNIDWQSIKSLIVISIPRTLALAVNQLVILFLLSFASLMSVGSISIFNFSWNLQSVPLSIIGASYSLAAFPTLSLLFSSGKREEFENHLIIGMRHIVFWSVPVAVLFIVLRAQIVRTVLGSGEFNWSNTRLVAASLAIFAISAVAQSLILLFTRAFYGSGKTKIPFFVNIVSGCIGVGLSYILILIFKDFEFFRYFIESLFRVSDISGTEILMLPLGFSIASLFNCYLLWRLLNIKRTVTPFIKSSAFQSLSASIIMGFISYLSLNIFDQIFNINTLIGIFMQGFCAGIIGLIVWALILKLLKNEEISEIWKTLHSKIWKAKPVIGEATDL